MGRNHYSRQLRWPGGDSEIEKERKTREEHSSQPGRMVGLTRWKMIGPSSISLLYGINPQSLIVSLIWKLCIGDPSQHRQAVEYSASDVVPKDKRYGDTDRQEK